MNCDINAEGDTHERKNIEGIEVFTKLKMKEKEKGKTKVGWILKQCCGIRKTSGSLRTAVDHFTGDKDGLHKKLQQIK